ncbi:MAG: hypothetical protein ACJ8H8_31255 [Geminicoccaceae bacterium]
MDRLPHLGPQPSGALDDGAVVLPRVPSRFPDHRGLAASFGERVKQIYEFDDPLLVSVRHGGATMPEARKWFRVRSAHPDPQVTQFANVAANPG